MSKELSVLGNNKEIKSTKIMKFTGTDFKEITPCVLLDTSGSMNRNDCPNGESRINIVNEAAKKMSNLPVFEFNDTVKKAEYKRFEAVGSTNLFEALEVCRKYPKVILVGDGCPDDKTKSMVKAISLGIPFDTILIGSDPEGKTFMQELSSRTCGKFSTVETSDLQFQEKLEAGIDKLLLCGEHRLIF